MTLQQPDGRGETLLVICRANAARSPLVAGLLRVRLELLGRSDLRVLSAGLEATPEMRATDEAVQVALEYGVDLAGHTAVRVTEELVREAALVLTMTESQRDAVERLARSAVPYTFTVPELVRLVVAVGDGPVGTWSELARRAHRARPLVAPSAAPEDVPDPVGQPWRHYRALAEKLSTMSHQVVSQLSARPVVSSG